MSQKPHPPLEEPEVIGHPTLSAWVFRISLTCGFLAIGFAFAMLIKIIITGEPR